MNTCIKGAKSNNLKNISVNIPINHIIGISGVSGSGKSTLVKDIIAKYGYINYLLNKNKTLKNSLIDYTAVDVEGISNLQPVLLIDVINQVNNRRSTLSTITGLHNILRNMFYEYGELFCENCNSKVNLNVYEELENLDYNPIIELEVTDDFNEIIEQLSKYTKISNTTFYNKDKKVTKVKKSRKYATLYLDFPKDELRQISKSINMQMGYDIKLEFTGCNKVINLSKELFCSHCHNIMPKLSLKQFSFNVSDDEGGGQCKECNGLGEILSSKAEKFIEDEDKTILNGAIKFLSSKGIKYTTIDAQTIDLFAKRNGFKKTSKLSELSEEQKYKLFFGSPEIINYKVKGENRQIEFKGIINYLSESLSKGKGQKVLKSLFEVSSCPECNGTRLNHISDNIKIKGYTLKDFLRMSIKDLYKTLNKIKEEDKISSYINNLQERLKIYCELSCGHLTLDRSSNTLSGGELQRLRLGAYICESISSMCIILDEPTTGLHIENIKDVINILYRLKSNGNTIILVEHNKTILNCCDYIIDLGPYGGNLGGNIIISDYIKNLKKYDTFTAKYLLEDIDYKKSINNDEKKIKNVFNIKSSNIFNLKQFEVNIPKEFIISICGVSGGGKSTFVNKCLIPQLLNPEYNIKNIKYLSQNTGNKNTSNKVVNLLGISDEIAKVYSNLGTSFDKNYFMLNSIKGKCDNCKGKGKIYSIENEDLGYCDLCNGKRFNEDTLKVKYKEMNINDVLSSSIDDILQIFNEYPNIYNILQLCSELGIGYLTLDRESKSLSKGEFQRINLVKSLNDNEKNSIFILDEPTKALHNKDLLSLIEVLRRLQKNKNTIIVIEHNIDFIMKSDYILELGPGAGENGGNLIFQGYPKEILEASTPTARGIRKEINCNSKKIKSENKISWDIDGIKYDIEENKINYLDIDSCEIKLIEKHIDNEYIKAVIPTYTFINYDKKMKHKIKNTPIIRKINFSEKSLDSRIDILQFLNLEYEISLTFARQFNDKKYKFAKSVYNKHKKTGKCSVCKGNGRIREIDLSLLLSGGNLNRQTKKFLKECSSYDEVNKLLKKEYMIDIGKSFDDMNLEEKNIFLYGSDDKVINISGRKYVWQGLVNIIFQQSRYYPDQDIIQKIKQGANINDCPACHGTLLKRQYAYKEVYGLTYSDIMKMKINDIFNNIKNYGDPINNKLFNILKMSNEFGLGGYTLNTPIAMLSNIDYVLFEFIAYYNNNLYGSIINIMNLELLDKNIIDEISKYLKEWCKSNTIIINKN